jgi:dUTP pyrophosphatase
MKKVLITRNQQHAVIPTRGSPKAAGYDLYSTESYTLRPNERRLFKTGLNMAIPFGMYGRIAPRSGLAFKKGIDVLAGVIDEDYRGDIGVILINLGQEDFKVVVGDKIAQIIFEFYNEVLFEEQTVQSNPQEALGNTERGSGGFGSTDTVAPPNASTSKFTLKKTTTVRRFYNENSSQIHPSLKIEIIEVILGNFHGEIYEYEENGFKGVCVVDSSGEVHPLSKTILARA